MRRLSRLSVPMLDTRPAKHSRNLHKSKFFFLKKSLTLSSLICAPNLKVAQKLLRKAKIVRGC